MTAETDRSTCNWKLIKGGRDELTKDIIVTYLSTPMTTGELRKALKRLRSRAKLSAVPNPCGGTGKP